MCWHFETPVCKRAATQAVGATTTGPAVPTAAAGWGAEWPIQCIKFNNFRLRRLFTKSPFNTVDGGGLISLGAPSYRALSHYICRGPSYSYRALSYHIFRAPSYRALR